MAQTRITPSYLIIRLRCYFYGVRNWIASEFCSFACDISSLRANAQSMRAIFSVCVRSHANQSSTPNSACEFFTKKTMSVIYTHCFLQKLISLVKVSRIDFCLNIVKLVAHTVSNNHISCLFELSKIVDHT